jgi:hypothetical protein
MRESSLEAMLLLAGLYAMHSKHGKARILLEGLRELIPDDGRVLRLLAHSLLMTGEYGQSLDALAALEAHPEMRERNEGRACLLRLRASALWGLQRTEEARTALEESAACLSKNKEIR